MRRPPWLTIFLSLPWDLYLTGSPMELKNKFKTLTDYVNAENWDGVSDIFEDLLENHGQQTDI